MQKSLASWWAGCYDRCMTTTSYTDHMIEFLASIDIEMGIVSRRRHHSHAGPAVGSTKAERLARLAEKREKFSNRLAAHIAQGGE